MDDILTPVTAAATARRIAMRALNAPFDLTRRTLASMAGITFGGRRDSYNALGYKRILLPADFRARYRRGGIAARIVEAFPEASWRGGGAVYDDPDPEETTEFEEQFGLLNKRLKLWQMFCRADVVAGLGRYAIILLGAPGELQEPLTKCKPEELKFLTPYGEDDAKITQYDENYYSERYSHPVQYSLTRRWEQWPGQQNPPSLPAISVHYTRVIHIADCLLDDNIFGMPRLERVWNLLDDLDKVIGGGAEAFWKRADGGTQYKIDPELTFDPDPAKAEEEKKTMEKKLNAFTDELERSIITRGIDINRMGSDVADLRGPAAAIMDQIAATVGIPQRILMGSELGKLASSKDQSNFDDRVQDRRKNHCEPNIARKALDRFIELGVLPPPTDEEYEVDWPEKEDLDQKERVAAAAQVAAVNSTAKQIIVLPSEIRTIYLGLPAMTDEQLAEAETIKEDALKQAQELMQQKAGLQGPTKPEDRREEKTPFVRAAAEYTMEDALLDDNLQAVEEMLVRALSSTPEPVDQLSRSVKKHIQYGEIEGVMRPVAIIEE